MNLLKLKSLDFKVIGFIIFILFLIFSFTVARDFYTNIDLKITIFFQSFIPDFLITPFSFFSIIGSAEITGISLLVVLFIFRVRIEKAILIVMLFVLTGIIELFLKASVHHLAPPEEFLKTSLHLAFPTGGVASGFYAYPSGHSARFIFVSIILIFGILFISKLNDFQKKFFIFIILFLDLIMLVSRVYLGEHWMSDVAGGLLLGASLAFISSAFLIKGKWGRETARWP